MRILTAILLLPLGFSAPAIAQEIDDGRAPPSFQIADVTLGVASFTPSEIAIMTQMYQNPSQDENYRVTHRIVDDGERALTEAPQPYVTVITSGEAVTSGQASNSKEVDRQAYNSLALALSFKFTGKRYYLDQLRSYLVGWGQSNHPQGDAIASTKFIPMIRAYDIVRADLSSADQTVIESWLYAMVDSLIASQQEARERELPRGINNHRSHAMLVIATIGCVIRESRYIRYVTEKTGFLDHVATNLRSFPDEPNNLGYDYHQRKAIHYVAYNLQALGQLAILLDRLSHLPGNPYGIHYDPYSVEIDRASIIATLWALMPYATSEKKSNHEFVGSLDSHDPSRMENGNLKISFNPHDALPALEAAYYFFPTLTDDRSGKSYDIAKVGTDLVSTELHRLSMPAGTPTIAFFFSRIQAQYGPGRGR